MRAADATGGAQDHSEIENRKSKIENAPTLGDEAAALAHDLGLSAPSHVVSAACASGLVALIDAALSVAQEEAPSALVLGIDVASSFVRDGFKALKALSPSGTCRPFDAHRDGLTVGSGTAAAVVSRHPPTSHRESQVTCVLSGWGASADAVHLTAPDRQAGGLIRAIQLGLAMAGLQPTDVDLIFAHGTGTPYNDAMEAAAFQSIFAFSRRPAITAVKGLIGHTLGASGLLESALAAHILGAQVIPPITKLQAPEYPDLDLVQSPRRTRVRHILKVASGFGGLNAALILSQAGGA
jgi:3-oxoacyl-[acyl-carrier-protein] synthase II